jgi:hypothetical protein
MHQSFKLTVDLLASLVREPRRARRCSHVKLHQGRYEDGGPPGLAALARRGLLTLGSAGGANLYPVLKLSNVLASRFRASRFERSTRSMRLPRS